MSACIHSRLDADFKASFMEGQFRVCFRVWCDDCLTDFQVTEDVKTSQDLRQMMVRIVPAGGFTSALSMTEH